MSTLSEIGEAAKAIKELAQTTSHLCILASDVLREAETLGKQGHETTAALQKEVKELLDAGDGLATKADVLLGGVAGIVAQVEGIVAGLRAGQWVEVDALSFGGELKMSGRVRIAEIAGGST